MNWPTSIARVFRISREDEHELSGHLPELHDLPRAEDFEASVSERNRLGMEDLDLRSDLWESGAAQSSPEEIEGLAAALAQAVEPLSGKDKWKLAAVYAGKYGDVHRQPWDQLISFVRLVHREAANAQESFVKYGPEASDNSAVKEQERIAGEILAHLEDGGKLGSLTLFTHKVLEPIPGTDESEQRASARFPSIFTPCANSSGSRAFARISARGGIAR